MNKQELPELPYAYDALEPVISKEIMELHHKKHHQGYVNNLNAALENYSKAEKAGDLPKMLQLQQAIRFNAGGHLNHSIFWTNLAPANAEGGNPPTGALLEHIEKQWGSLEKFISTFNSTVGPLQGSGWGWLAFCLEHKELYIVSCPNQDPVSLEGYIPLLGIDVWEHAYYLDYKNARPEYLKNIWKVVNWSNVESRFEQACALGTAR